MAKPPSFATMTTTPGPPATPSAAAQPTSITFPTRPDVSSHAASPRPPPQQRRSARPASADFLSDRATIALVRRTLCAQHAADRGKNSPAPIEELLPPLTSRNDVDLQLYALISIVLRDYVQTWYSKISPDETFVAEIVQIIAHCTRALEQRLRKVDLGSLLLDELPELLDAHVRAYRTAKASITRPPIEANVRDIYHSLCPLPALSPVPKAEDVGATQQQASNEAAYRQLLVQGVLALLLPTEDLENECLTSLVGQILSELIIGNLIVNKLSEPWLLWEIFIILTRLAKKREPANMPPESPEHTDLASPCTKATTNSRRPPGKQQGWSFHQAFWAVVQWLFFMVSSIRLVLNTVVTSRALPPRPVPVLNGRQETMGGRGGKGSYQPPHDLETQEQPSKVPIAAFSLWPCIANLLEMDARMPWLRGALSMLQWGAMRGPGMLAGYDGVIDRLLSHHVQTRLLDPSHLPPLLRTVRGAVFPNNAPGTSSLVAPSSDEELAALRRRCASAIWALVPRGVGRIYFGSLLASASSTAAAATSPLSSSSPTSQNGRAPGPGEGNATVCNGGGPGPLTSDTSSPSAARRGSGPVPPASYTSGVDEPAQARLTQSGGTRYEGNAAAPTAAPPSRQPERGRDPNVTAAATNDTGETGATVDGEALANAGRQPSYDQDEHRILSEIETGILDVFSDGYCNKHLLYSILELVLVRLMPELAERGVIDLWEERLS